MQYYPPPVLLIHILQAGKERRLERETCHGSVLFLQCSALCMVSTVLYAWFLKSCTYGFAVCSRQLISTIKCSDTVQHRLAVLGARHTAVSSCATCSCSSLFFCRSSSTSFLRASASMLSGGPPWRWCFTKLVRRAQDKIFYPIGSDLHCKQYLAILYKPSSKDKDGSMMA